jgi:hypothetical protein
VIKTKYTEIIVCDICDVEIPEQITCGICSRDICPIHRNPSSMENRPSWYPLFSYLCLDCATHHMMKDVIDNIQEINRMVATIHYATVGDEMGQLANKEGGDE